jgi:DNA polymerase-4
LVEKVSIDEGYLDVTEAAASMHPIRLAQKIQAEIKARLQLPSSIGIAPNKFLAKMASNMKKPMGLTILRKRELPQLLWPLPIEEMHGVGPKTAEKLYQLNIHTIGDLARSDSSQIKNGLGQQGEKLHQRANGCDSRPVDPKAESVYKSMSQSTTLPADLTQLNEARPHFKRFSKKLMDKLSQQGKVAYQIQVQIRYSNWEQVTRMKTFTEPIPGPRELETAAIALFSDHWTGRPVRLLGLSVQQLEDKLTQSKQLDLFSFEKEAQKEPLYKVMDALKTRYGQGLIQFGVKETPQPEEET